MGLLDGVIGSVLKNQGLGAIFGEMNPQYAGLLTHLIEIVNSPQVGGIGGLVAHLQKGGLGGVVNSWIGTGANQQVTGEQLQSALPADLVAQLSARTGLDAEQVAHGLAQVLPKLVDLVSPDGNLPHESSLQETLGGLLSAFGGK
jgi:uncharacterized protein YidB (DUF937 family)